VGDRSHGPVKPRARPGYRRFRWMPDVPVWRFLRPTSPHPWIDCATGKYTTRGPTPPPQIRQRHRLGQLQHGAPPRKATSRPRYCAAASCTLPRQPGSAEPERHGDRRLARQVEGKKSTAPTRATAPARDRRSGRRPARNPRAQSGTAPDRRGWCSRRHGVAGGGAQCLGVHERDALMPPSRSATSRMPGSSSPRRSPAGSPPGGPSAAPPDTGKHRGVSGRFASTSSTVAPASVRIDAACSTAARPSRHRRVDPAGAGCRAHGRRRRPRCRAPVARIVRMQNGSRKSVAREGRKNQRRVAHAARHRPEAATAAKVLAGHCGTRP